ncbi:MAG: hypothetical protein RBS73_00690 [Prolixibacteraceae bacterium]|jgi:hypothetical protein|nr:hypothetical protein [Prolixibacteraceae bacterium]
MKFPIQNKRQKEEQKTSKGSLAAGILYKRIRSAWAAWMARRTAGFTRSTWRILLSLFVVLFGGYSVYLAVNGFTARQAKSISITPIKIPRHATQTGDTPKAAPQLSEAGYSRIRQFRIYMDSLARSPTGKATYDSIIKHRPGLMDSVRFIENQYQP